RVALVSVMWANNEVGTVNPIRELAAIAHEFGVPMHTDAVQAVGVLPVDFAASGVDALSLTGHKLGGPIGAGALLLGREVVLTPLLHGGGQERDVRSGTLDTPAGGRLAAALGLAGGDAAQPRAARHGRRRGHRPRLTAVLPRPHVHRRRRRRGGRRDRSGRRAGPARGFGGGAMRVLAAMSGGVDSAVAAARAVDAG